ncbi:hypothetical protein SLEP1_g54811 [Rubroshorea leprosula]|uniref:Uncharacterized protein n=1 Tax=Rubroshorea leprosula TaxID=152421 RepID=A0AAV5MDK7_9ROSI|nr:hypothetical protein SLEP1_g54811 [Rubroshorea leprosula]
MEHGDVVQDLRIEPTYFIENRMIPCTVLDEKLSCQVTNLKVEDGVTPSVEERLSSSMGEFVLSWKYFNKDKSVLTVQPILFTLETWYDHLLETVPIGKRQYSGISIQKFYLYPLLRLCTKWLKCAFEHQMCHGNLIDCIFFKTATEPRLLIQRGDGSYRTDLKTIRHFLFVIVNWRPREELKTEDDKFNYNEFNNNVPRYLIDFLQLLGAFDELTHSVDVVFNPSFLWSIEKKFKHLEEAFVYFIKEPRLDEINRHCCWQWYNDFLRLPARHVLRDIYMLAGEPRIVQLRPGVARNGNPYYTNNAQLLRLFRNTRCHVTEMLGGRGWTQDVVLEEFEERFNILSRLSQTCNAYAMDRHQTSRKWFLRRLGYIASEKP